MSRRSSAGRPVDAARFRRACSKFATGVAIATVVSSDGQPHGMTVNSFTSVSLEPPLVLVCVDAGGNMAGLFAQASHYGVNVLRESQADLSNRFSQRGFDRFDSVAWTRGAAGVPMLDGALARFECAVRHRVVAGDHSILIAEVVAAEYEDGAPLLYFDSGYRALP